MVCIGKTKCTSEKGLLINKLYCIVLYFISDRIVCALDTLNVTNEDIVKHINHKEFEFH